MADQNNTPTATPGKKQSRGRSHAKKNAVKTERTREQPTGNIGINFRAEAGDDNPIYQAVNFAYNRLCGAHQNQTTPFSAIDLVAYVREKWGPKTMTVNSQTA